jgi:hypothetical protein
MTLTDSGFEVERGSSITINSQARNMNVNLTAFPNAVDCVTTTLPLQVTDSGLNRTGAFVAASAGLTGSAMLSFNFRPGDDAADYLVTISEVTTGGQVTTITDDPPVSPPPISRRGYTFVIR